MPFTLTVRSQCSVSERREIPNTKMQLRLFILSVAVFSCVLPPALGSLHLLKAAAAVGAVKGAALLGAGALAVKGAAIKGAAIGAVKGAAVKGAAILAAKGAVVKGAVALAAKAANLAVQKLPPVQPLLVQKPVPVIVEQPIQPIIVEQPSVEYTVPANTVSIRTYRPAAPRLPSILNSLSSLWSSAQEVAQHKAAVVSSALQSLHQPIPAEIRAPIVYQYALPPRFYPAPLPMVQRVDDDCA